MRKKFLSFNILIGLALFSVPFFANATQIVQCAGGMDHCTLCDLFSMLQNAFTYLTIGVLGVVTLFIIVIVGLMFLFGAANPGLLETAKKALTTTVIGFAIILSCWLIIAEVGRAVGWTRATEDEHGAPSRVGTWWKISCDGT